MTLTWPWPFGNGMNKTLELYLSSYQIQTKSIKRSGKYKLLKNFNVNVDANADTNANSDANANANADAGGSAIALPWLRPGELKRVWHESKHKLGGDLGQIEK